MDSLINRESTALHQFKAKPTKPEHTTNSRVFEITEDTLDSLNLLDEDKFNELRSSLEAYKRVKRVHVFRPLFAYRQEQQIRILEGRKSRL